MRQKLGHSLFGYSAQELQGCNGSIMGPLLVSQVLHPFPSSGEIIVRFSSPAVVALRPPLFCWLPAEGHCLFLEASSIHYSPCMCPPLTLCNISAYFSQDSKDYSLFNQRVLCTMTESQKWPLIVFAVYCWLEKSQGRGLYETAIIGTISESRLTHRPLHLPELWVSCSFPGPASQRKSLCL